MLIDTTPIEGELRELGPLEFQLVRRTGDEPLFNSLLEQHHYLRYEQPVRFIAYNLRDICFCLG